MKHGTKFWHLFIGLLPILLCALAVGGLLLGAQPAFAAANAANACDGTSNDPDTCTGRTTGNGLVCMGDLSGFGTGINCTANDVSIGFADNVRDSNGNTIRSCVQGSTLTNATADFHVVTSGGVTRYDIGLYFAIDGDPNHDGAKSGGCSVSKISQNNNISGNFLQLDPSPPDTCGDIDNGHKPQVVRITFSTPCQPSPLFFNPTTGQCQATAPSPTAAHCVILPNGVSWRQTGANDVCDSPLDAFPGTTSKCNVNPTFGIPVIVEQANVVVDKTASPLTVPETGGTVTYTVKVTNMSSVVTLTIDTVTDSLYGNLADASNPNVTNNTCPSLVGVTLQPNQFTTCTFDAFVSGDFNPPGTPVTDTAEVCGHDNAGHTNLCGHHDATVTLTDVSTSPSLTKSVDTFVVDVNYKVVVANPSTDDTLTVNTLTDDKFGDITVVHAASGGVEEVVSTDCNTLLGSANAILPGGNKTCHFVGRIINTLSHTNTATASATDSDGASLSASGTATVTITTSHNP